MFTCLKSVTYEVDNVAPVKEWYERLLKQKPIFESPFAVVFQIGASSLSFINGESGATDGPAVYWEVDSVADCCDELQNMEAELIGSVSTVMNRPRAKLVDPFGNRFGISGSASAVKERTVKRESSETAMVITLCRALASLDEREAIRGDDNIAHIFLSAHYKKGFDTRESRAWAKKKLGAVYGYVSARSRYGERIFRGCTEREYSPDCNAWGGI